MNLIAPSETDQRIILPEQKKIIPDFSALVIICTHRDIKIRVLNMIRYLERCPNPKIEIYPVEGDALISRSRSRAATKFLLDTKHDMLMFLDDDIVIDTRDVTKILWECYQGYDIVGATYVVKELENPTFTFRSLQDEDFSFGDFGKIYEAMYLSTGCMAIHRKVFEAMVDSGRFHLCNKDTLRFYPFFQPMEKEIETGKWIYLSEDWGMCNVARELGFKVWVDSTIKVGHIGSFVYDWDVFGMPKKSNHKSLLYQVRVQKE